MENGALKTTISEDSPTSEAPLYSLDVEVLPPPGESFETRSTASARIAPIAMMTNEWKKAAEWNWLDLCEILV